MTSWSNPVEDPEKHFLGNLLDDETSFSASPPTSRVYTESSIPTTSVINSVGPINGASDGPSRYWPEPPPPYTPAKSPNLSSPWGLSSCEQAGENSIHLDGLLNTALKEPSTWGPLLDFTSPSGFGTSSSSQQKPTEIHHHQHTHQHTHVLQVINKHHYGSPLEVSHFADTPFSQPFASVVRKSTEIKRPQNLPPHSAPVVHKMPFSYRDVAASKKDVHSNGHSPTQVKGKVTTAESEPKLNSGKSTESISTDFETSKSGKESKQKQDNEFQKISRKKTAKEKRAMSDSSAPPQIQEIIPVPVVDVPTRYQVLENLSSPKIVKTESVDSDDVVFVSKAESIEEHAEDQEIDISPPRIKKTTQVITEAKKKAVPTPVPKKRTTRRKQEAEHWIFRLIWGYLVIFVETVQDSMKWLMVLVVDVCTRSGELFLYMMQSICDCCVDFVKGIAQYIIGIFLTIFFTCRQVSFRQLFFSTPPDTIWGLDENIILPSTTDEALERILRVRHVDAYSILGLRADCTDEDIIRHRNRLNCLLNADKTPLEGMEEAENIVETAHALLRTPECRELYILGNISKIPAVTNVHNDLLDLWDTFRMKIEESRHTMLCDCGKRHARIPTNIKVAEARYCKRCSSKHPARPNDLWVETRLFGMAWIYYTCADGVVYDITEWATCDTNYLKHMRPNAHVVQYRLVSPGTPMDRSNQALQEFLEETSWGVHSTNQKSSRAQVSYRPLEPRDEDRSRRAANRRQKRRL